MKLALAIFVVFAILFADDLIAMASLLWLAVRRAFRHPRGLA